MEQVYKVNSNYQFNLQFISTILDEFTWQFYSIQHPKMQMNWIESPRTIHLNWNQFEISFEYLFISLFLLFQRKNPITVCLVIFFIWPIQQWFSH